MNITIDRVVHIPDTVLFQEVSGEAVLLDLASEQYFGLNDVGTQIWHLLVEHRRLSLVHARLLSEYDADPGILKQDLLELVGALVEAGLVSLEPQAAGSE